MMTFENIKKKLNSLGDWEEKYEFLITLGKKLPPMPPDLKTSQYKVTSCTSDTWVHISFINNEVEIKADSASQIVKGVLYVLAAICYKRTPQDCAKINAVEMLNSLGLLSNISASRYNGIQNIIVYIRRACLDS